MFNWTLSMVTVFSLTLSFTVQALLFSVVNSLDETISKDETQHREKRSLRKCYLQFCSEKSHDSKDCQYFDLSSAVVKDDCEGPCYKETWKDRDTQLQMTAFSCYHRPFNLKGCYMIPGTSIRKQRCYCHKDLCNKEFAEKGVKTNEIGSSSFVRLSAYVLLVSQCISTTLNTIY